MTKLSMQNESFSQSHSPTEIRRSHISKDDNCASFNFDNDHEDLKSDTINTFEKPGSIPSVKMFFHNDQWSSTEYVTTNIKNGRSKSYSVRSPTVYMSSQFKKMPPCLSSDKMSLAACLSKCDAQNMESAKGIMRTMNFTGMSLVESLQVFLRKIPVIGESQDRDRILTHFTARFMDCNPRIFKDNDSCHTLVCAIMLLNSDIHGPASTRKMTCKEFVDNIQTNYPQNEYNENYLVNVYKLIKITKLKSEHTETIRKKLSKLFRPVITTSPISNSVVLDPDLLNQRHFISGKVVRKCVKKSFGRRPSLGHRGWKLQFASLIGLQLVLFKTNVDKNGCSISESDRVSLADSNISNDLFRCDESSFGTTKSARSKLPSNSSREDLGHPGSEVECSIRIHHALARLEDSLKHRSVFVLRLADQSEYIFKVKADQLHAWVNTINYAAALLSAPPIDGVGQSTLYKPLLPAYLTDFDEAHQILSHETQIQNYSDSLRRLQASDYKVRDVDLSSIRFCKYEVTRFEYYVKILSSDSMISTPQLLNIDPQRSHSFSNHSHSLPPAEDTTETVTAPSAVDLTTSPVVCSQKMKPHLFFTLSLGARPTPSFSRFARPFLEATNSHRSPSSSGPMSRKWGQERPANVSQDSAL